jgi:hypothetical protein
VRNLVLNFAQVVSLKFIPNIPFSGAEKGLPADLQNSAFPPNLFTLNMQEDISSSKDIWQRK